MNDLQNSLPADVILMHFGGPTCSSEVEPFLMRLFQDPFIIRAPIGAWGRRKLGEYIARKRWQHTDEQYRAIGYSPINRYTHEQAQHLETLVQSKHPSSRVHVVNRYTAPFASEVIPLLDHAGERRLFMTTLYPHFSHSTAGSSIRDFDQAWEAARGEKTRPSTRVFSWWWHKKYLNYSWQKLCNGLTQAAAAAPGMPITVIFSAHGLPQRYADRGDPYQHDIKAHFATLKQRARDWVQTHLAGGDVHFELSFQSRVGPVEWMRPYTEDTIRTMGAKRQGTVLLVPISFVSDHIETLFEMDKTYRELSMRSGFKHYFRVALPNGEPALAQCLFDILSDYGL